MFFNKGRRIVRRILKDAFKISGVKAVRFENGFLTYTGCPEHIKHSVPLSEIQAMNFKFAEKYVGKDHVRFIKK